MSGLHGYSSVPVRFYRRNGRQMILADSIESDSIEAAVPNNALLTALAKAYAWQEQLESGQFEDLEDIAKEQGVDRSYVGRILQLTSLAPDIVESILAGQLRPRSANIGQSAIAFSYQFAISSCSTARCLASAGNRFPSFRSLVSEEHQGYTRSSISPDR